MCKNADFLLFICLRQSFVVFLYTETLRKGSVSFANMQGRKQEGIMKRRLYTGIGLLLCCSMIATAQVKNYISLWGNVGEASLLSKLDNMPTNGSMGVGGGLGVGYELNANHFLFTVGVSANIAHSAFNLSGGESTFDAIDTQGDPLEFIISTNKRKDVYTNTSVQVPLMIGGEFGRFYFLAGAKFDLSVNCATNVKATVRTVGDYTNTLGFIDKFTNMPEHGFYENAEFNAQQGKIKFNPNVMASAEIGWRLGLIAKGTGYDVPKPKTIYRIALFADYGLLDLHQRGQKEFFTWTDAVIDYDCLNYIGMNDVLSTNRAPKAVNNLLVGVKFTVLFQLPERKACVICRDGYRGIYRNY